MPDLFYYCKAMMTQNGKSVSGDCDEVLKNMSDAGLVSDLQIRVGSEAKFSILSFLSIPIGEKKVVDFNLPVPADTARAVLEATAKYGLQEEVCNPEKKDCGVCKKAAGASPKP